MNIRYATFGLIAATGGLVATLGSAPAPAAESQTLSAIVHYDARDLRTATGAERLLSRVSGLAHRLCAENGSMGHSVENREFRTCTKDAIERAVEQVNRPTLTAAYNRHFGEKGVRGGTTPA
jgi:UrcA family protein